MEDSRLEKIQVRLGTLGTLKVDLLFDLLKLELHECIVRITSTMEIREDLECFILPVPSCQYPVLVRCEFNEKTNLL